MLFSISSVGGSGMSIEESLVMPIEDCLLSAWKDGTLVGGGGKGSDGPTVSTDKRVRFAGPTAAVLPRPPD